MRAIVSDLITMAALATMVVIGLRLAKIAAWRDRGQPWTLHHADYEEAHRTLHAGVRLAAQESPGAHVQMDAGAVLREAEQIVATRYRGNR